MPWQRGNQLGHGSRIHRRMRELRQEVLDALSPTAMREVIDSMVRLACEGDVAAARVVLAYGCGTPAEHTRALDFDEMREAQQDDPRGLSLAEKVAVLEAAARRVREMIAERDAEAAGVVLALGDGEGDGEA